MAYHEMQTSRSLALNLAAKASIIQFTDVMAVLLQLGRYITGAGGTSVKPLSQECASKPLVATPMG